MLFDLDADPDEQTNVSQQQREVCDDLRKRLAAWLKYEQRLLERLHGEGAK
jgi:hypothetical protein